MSKVVHLSSTSHARAKAYCQTRQLRMSEWVGTLIEAACREAGVELEPAAEAGRDTVGKKALPKEPSQAVVAADGQPSYAAPPFWAETPA